MKKLILKTVTVIIALSMFLSAFTVTASAKTIKTEIGDINADGSVNGKDATLLLKYLADWDVDIRERNADVNGDEKKNGRDATTFLKYLADWDVTLAECEATVEIEKETSGMDKFEITYFYGPHGENALNEDYWQAIADAGFTTVPLELLSPENNIKALSLMKKYGLTCYALSDERISGIAYSDADYTQEQVDEIVRNAVEYYAECDNLIGWNLADEPNTGRFSNLAKLVDALRRIDPERKTCINLFPNYANSVQLGVDSYEEYLEKFIAEVKPDYISFDHYHFYKNGSAGVEFFANLEAVREASLANNLDYMAIVLLTQHMGYADISYSQLSWEVNMALAYGCKKISYFTFILDKDLLDQGWTDGCMSYLGEKYQHYYDVQKMNKTLVNLGNELFDKTTEAVFHLTGNLQSGCKAYTASYGKLGKINGNNLTISFFDDDSFMLVNEFYKNNMYNVNVFTLEDVKENLEYFDIEANEWKPYETKDKNGLYKFTLSPGEGVLLRVAE